MRILYAFDNRVPSPQADTEQLVCTLAALSRRGLAATLLVPRDGPEPGAREIRAYYGVEGSFAVHRFRAPATPRVAQKLWSAVRTSLAGRTRRHDVVYTRNLPVAFGATLAGHRAVLDTYRPWPRQVPALRSPLRRLMRSDRFLGAVLHSELARSAYLELGVPAERLLTAHNGYEPSQMEPVLDREEARARLSLPAGRPIALYSGRVDRDKGLDVILDASRELPGVLFLLVGASGEGELEREARARTNVRLVPWRPVKELSGWLYAADVLLLSTARSPVERHGNTVLPMKLFKYLAAGRPVLGPRREDVEEILEDGVSARLVEPERPEAAAAGLSEILDHPGLAERLGQGARRKARTLTWDARAERIHGFLERRLGGTSAG